MAPDYEPEALEILQGKKSSNFIVLKSNCDYFDTMHKEGWTEERKIFGMTLRQPFNSFTIKPQNDTTTAVINSHPKEFKMFASNNSSTWTEISHVSDLSDETWYTNSSFQNYTVTLSCN